MAEIEIKRGYEVLPDNNIRFGIRVINNSEFLIVDVEVILDFSDSLFKLDGNLVHNLGIINPTAPRTAEFVLKPLACIHKEEISATVRYKDHTGKRYTVDMHPKEVHCVCPFLKEKSITRTEFLDLSKKGYSAEAGLNFHGVNVQQLSDFLVKNCKNRHYKVDEFSVDGGKMLYLASESIGEKATYLITAFIRETDGLAQVMLKATSDKPHGLNGFLNEMVETLRHIVSTVKSAKEIGVIKKEQVINIIDSVVQRTSFEMGGEGASSINIKDSVVQRTEFNAVDEEKKKRDEEERLHREVEERRVRKEKQQLRKKEMRVQESQKGSFGKFFAVALVLGVLLLGFWAFTSSASDAPKSSKISPTPTPKLTPTVTHTPKITPTVFTTPIAVPAAETKTIINSIGVEFMPIPTGEFDMGSPLGEKDRDKDEGPVHRIKISYSFYIGKYEVTQKQWHEVMGTNPSKFKGDDLPVEQVSWNDVQEFIKKLNQKEGTDKYRLPSEAEWEYVARAGTTTRYSFGDGEIRLGEYAWYGDNSGSKTHTVGQKKPNPWGLYDMHGNVWEWVQDWSHGDYDSAPTDGSAWERRGGGSFRVLRGGGWCYFTRDCRSASRHYNYPGYRYSDIGFRLVMDAPVATNSSDVQTPKLTPTVSTTPIATTAVLKDDVSLTLMGNYDTESALGVAVSGSYEYVADGYNGFIVFDISNPIAPTLAESYDVTGGADSIAVSGNYIYGATDNGLVIVDVSNPTAPTLVGRYNTAGKANGVAVSGSYAYVADGYNGLVIVDISNPTAPALASNYDTDGIGTGVAVLDNYAYIADDDNGLVIVDVSNPTAPTLAGSYNTGGDAYGIAVSGSYAYVADFPNGLVIVDISNPAAPTLAGSYNTGGGGDGWGYGVAVSGSYAYVVDYINGLIVVNISNPASPTLAGSYDTTGGAYSVAVSGNYAYVADMEGGFLILRIS